MSTVKAFNYAQSLLWSLCALNHAGEVFFWPYAVLAFLALWVAMWLKDEQ